MTDLLTKVKAALEGATPGPWRWDVNISVKAAELSGDNGELTVMDFARWGMSGAAPRFWIWSGRPRVGDPRRADEVAVPVVGREHHAHWFRTIDDPNALLIALAPDMARALIAAGELAEATRRLAKFSNSPAKAGRRWATYDCSQMTARVEDVGYTLDAFRAAMEGRTDDRP